MAFCAGSGGWASNPDNQEAIKRGMPRVQLYNLATDSGEINNLQAEHSNIVWMLSHLLLHYIDQGRSTLGKKQQNWKNKTRWKQVNWATK